MLHNYHEHVHLSRPTNDTFNSGAAAAAIAGAAGATVISEEANDEDYTRNENSFTQKQLANAEPISTIEFARMYTVAGIPFLDFIISYIILWVINAFFPIFDQKTVLLGSVPITIVYNLMTNPNVKMNFFLLVVMMISIYFIVVWQLDNK
jgi:hypothetical protein